MSLIQNLFSPKQNLSARLWRAGGLMAVLFSPFFIATAFVPKSKAVSMDMLGYDFLAFYYGGNCALTHHTEQLYDLSATRSFESKIAADAGLTLASNIC